MTPSVLDAIRNLLREHGVAFREVHHEPTTTSEQSAAARGEPLEIGGKAIVFKVDGEFRLFVLSAALGIESRAIRRRLRARRTRFASRQELAQITGLVPGCVPPFGKPILPLELFVDESIVANDRIAFNAGSLTDSIILSRADYMAVARPADVFRFSRSIDAEPAESP